MRIQILSDLHLELSSPASSTYESYSFPQTAPNLALLGDVGNTRDAGYFAFLRAQLRRYRRVFVVLGNHEPYHSSFPTAKQRIQDFENTVNSGSDGEREGLVGRLVVLDQDRYDVEDEEVTVLGCTLFSDVPRQYRKELSLRLQDFYQIGDWTTEEHILAHQSDLSWLNQQVQEISAKEPRRRIVVFTHHSPTMRAEANDPRHEGSAITCGFVTDLSKEACWRNRQVRLWGFGHTHWNCEFVEKETGKVVVANQRGYYFQQAKGYRPEKVFEV